MGFLGNKTLSGWFLADEPILLVVGVILGVPTEASIKVHVEIGVSSWFIFLEICECHLCSCEPLKTLVSISIHASNPVVGTILRVDSIENSLDEIALSSVKNVCQVSSSLITQLLGNQIVNMVASEHVAVAIIVDPTETIFAFRCCTFLDSILHHETSGELVKKPWSWAHRWLSKDSNHEHCQGNINFHHSAVSRLLTEGGL